MTSCPASTTTSTPAPRRLATARIIQDPMGLLDDPYRGVGAAIPIRSSPDRTRRYVNFGSFGTMDPGINSPRVQSWNATVEQQLGTQWGVSVAYLGSHSDRLWAQVALNPGVYMGLGPCVINGVSYPVCSTNANLNQRRVLYQQNPREAAFIGALDLNTDIGYQNYSGLKLSATATIRRRCEPQRQLHAVEVHGHAAESALQSVERRLSEAERPLVRRRLLRSGPTAPGDDDGGI